MKITKLSTDWLDVKNKCRTTVNQISSAERPNDNFKLNLLISEHSPIRLLRIAWNWPKIKYWLSTEFSRHHIGWEKWISTQRDDRTSIDRNKSPQDTLVTMDVEANAQSLINVSRFRLCHCAHPEARRKMEELKREIHKVEPQIADVMQPNCIYRSGCPEFNSCGWWDGFLSRHVGESMTNIKCRYELANKEFFEDN